MEEDSFEKDQKSKILDAVSLEMRIDLSKKHGKQLAKEIETILDGKQENDEDLNEAFEKVREANRATLNKLESDGSQNLLVLRGEEYELVSDLSVWLWKDKILDILGADFINDKTKPQSMLIQTLSKKYGNLRREGYSEEEASNCIQKLALGRPIEQAEFEVRPGYFNWMRAHPYLTFATVLTLGLLSPITGLWAYIDVRNEKNEIKENDRDIEVPSIEKLALNLWGLEVSDSNKNRYQYLKTLGYEPTREMMEAYIKSGMNPEELSSPNDIKLLESFFEFYLSGDPSMTVSKAKLLAEIYVSEDQQKSIQSKSNAAQAARLDVESIKAGEQFIDGSLDEGLSKKEKVALKTLKVALKTLLTVREFRRGHSDEEGLSELLNKLKDYLHAHGDILKGLKVKEADQRSYLISKETGERITAQMLLPRIYHVYLSAKYTQYPSLEPTEQARLRQRLHKLFCAGEVNINKGSDINTLYVNFSNASDVLGEGQGQGQGKDIGYENILSRVNENPDAENRQVNSEGEGKVGFPKPNRNDG